MADIYDCADETSRAEGIATAKERLGYGDLAVIPTDTVYGLAADAFSPTGVTAIFEAKGRGRDMPPPVLVPDARTIDGLAMALPSYVQRLVDAFWPGALTLVVRAQQSLMWDLGDSNGTVGLRMPDDEVALALLAETGPLAVSSANRTGKPPAKNITEAGFMLGAFVETFLDAGERAGGEPSTIVDCTKPDPTVLRQGAIPAARIQEVLGDGIRLVLPPELDDTTAEATETEAPGGADAAAGADESPAQDAPLDPAVSSDAVPDPDETVVMPLGSDLDPATPQQSGPAEPAPPTTVGTEQQPADSAAALDGEDGTLGGHWETDTSGSSGPAAASQGAGRGRPDDVDAAAADDPNWSYGEDVPREANRPGPGYPS